MADELIGNDFKFQIGDGAEPEVFADMCAAFDVGEIGEEKSLIDITTLCDDIMRYRNGLADGLEIPLQVNAIMQDEQIRALYDAYKDNTVGNYKIITKAPLPEDGFEFPAIVRAWRVSPPVNGRAVISFTLKIVGEVVWDQSTVA